MGKNNRLVQSECYFLDPGYIYFNREPVLLGAVLGSCVAVCLWDEVLKCGGMNHFLFPFTDRADKATPKYGNVATIALIRIMQEAGCRLKDIRAQIIGGAHPKSGIVNTLGERNVCIARRILLRKRIAIVSEDTGGMVGRKIVFDTGTGHVAVVKVHDIRKSDWFYEEQD